MACYKLRPHHGLCLLFFEGKGYSAKFTENMSCVKTALHDGVSIELVMHSDDICACCPNRFGDKCKSSTKVSAYDARVTEACDLTPNMVFSYTKLEEAIINNVLKKDLLPSVCGDCEWFSICEAALNKRNLVN